MTKSKSNVQNASTIRRKLCCITHQTLNTATASHKGAIAMFRLYSRGFVTVCALCTSSDKPSKGVTTENRQAKHNQMSETKDKILVPKNGLLFSINGKKC